MQEKQAWLFTITFKPNYTAAQKYKLINRLPTVIADIISFARDKEPILFYTIEYHKMKYPPFTGQNDVTAPHIHGILYHNKLGSGYASLVQKRLQQLYGRTQFFLKEQVTEVEGWRQYCLKDVQNNDSEYGYSHLIEKTLEEPQNESEDDLDF